MRRPDGREMAQLLLRPAGEQGPGRKLNPQSARRKWRIVKCGEYWYVFDRELRQREFSFFSTASIYLLKKLEDEGRAQADGYR